jgi:excisionase family DNA binding protein
MHPVSHPAVRHALTATAISSAPVQANEVDGKLAYSVAEFAKLSALSRSLLYEAIKLGELQSIKVRGRRLIIAEDGKTWLRSFRKAS